MNIADEPADSIPLDPDRRRMTFAGGFIGLGAAMMFAKGVLLITTGHDRSLVPWFGLFASVGLVLAASALWRSVERWRWLALLGGVGAAIGVVSSLIGVGYLLAGTIPESPDAPALVGFSYGVFSAGVALALLLVGLAILKNRFLQGGWRWLPVGLIFAQLPIFIVAGAIGDSLESEDLTDGLGLALTGVGWMLLGFALSVKQRLD